MTDAQKEVVDKVYDLLAEHFPHFLLVVEFEDAEREDRWITEYFHSRCSTAALVGMCEVARTLVLDDREAEPVDEDEDGGVPL